MTIPLWLQAAVSAVIAALAWLWWGKRKATQRADAAERRAEHATAERDQARGEADVSDARAKATTDQAARTASGQLDAKEIRDVPITGNPGGDRAALYERDRVLRTGEDRDR